MEETKDEREDGRYGDLQVREPKSREKKFNDFFRKNFPKFVFHRTMDECFSFRALHGEGEMGKWLDHLAAAFAEKVGEECVGTRWETGQ